MLRRDKEMSYEATATALAAGKWGVLSTFDGEAPYAVPVNYFYSHEDNAIFFHCALKGKKLDNINYNEHVSFAVVLQERIVPGRFTTLYQSVIVSGRAAVVENKHERIKRLTQICDVLVPESADKHDEYIMKYLSSVTVVRINVDSISGKTNSD
jgi:nitroimidazol reductase NimA-like FMN-containing flavoprotein (pyridoxamine 5'-phosphate oxidase superfamily)